MKIALIACGIWGQKILRDLQRFEVEVYVQDSNMKVKELSKKLGAKVFFLELSDLLNQKDIDAFILASPSSTHKIILEKLIPLNKPIFVEKPLTLNYEEVQDLATQDTSNIFVMHIWKYHEGIKKLGEIAHSCKLGEILSVKSIRTNWTSPRKDSNSLWNLAPHDLTIAELILGFIPTPKYVVAEKHEGQIRGVIAILGNNPYFTFEVSNRYPDKQREVRVQGTKGVAILKDDKVNYVEVHLGDASSRPEEVIKEKYSFESKSALENELECFINFVKTGENPPTTNFEEGFRVVKALDEIEKMIQT